MKTKNLMMAVAVVGTLMLATAAGCGDDEAGAAGFSCPKAGDKHCPNDTAATQATADSCKKCEAEYKAYDACLGGSQCGADGKTVEADLSKCPTELQALIKCVQGGGATPTDAGGGG